MPKSDRLKVYEYLYYRVPFTEYETQELIKMQKIHALEHQFEIYLESLHSPVINVSWHKDIVINNKVVTINAVLETHYCYYLFLLHDFSNGHYLNSNNILLNSNHECVLNLTEVNNIRQQFKNDVLNEQKEERPVIVKHVVMNHSFFMTGKRSDKILSISDLSSYLKAILSTLNAYQSNETIHV